MSCCVRECWQVVRDDKACVQTGAHLPLPALTPADAVKHCWSHNTRQAEAATATAKRPLRVMIAGAPAAGKGTQCERIVDKVCAAVPVCGRGWARVRACGVRRRSRAPCWDAPPAVEPLGRRQLRSSADVVPARTTDCCCLRPAACYLLIAPSPLQYNLVHISVGDLLREEVKNGTAAGEQRRSTASRSGGAGCDMHAGTHVHSMCV
jgi:hypothetical protein